MDWLPKLLWKDEGGPIKTCAEQILTVIKGKLEDWGDDIDKLPSDVKEKAITCYKNKDGCIF